MHPEPPDKVDAAHTLAPPDFRSDVEKLYSPLSVQKDNEDVGMAERIAEEYVNVVGGVVKVRIRTDNHFDEVWDEDADPTYHDAVPLKAFFKTEPLAEELTKWGVDTPNKSTVVFARKVVWQHFGERMLRTGDLIEIPYNAVSSTVKQFRVLNVSETGRFKTRWLYLSADVENLLGDVTVHKEGDK